MSTGRNACPPEWALNLNNLIAALQAAPVQLQPTPFCDAAGVVQGYVALIYQPATGTITTLHFDTAYALTNTTIAGAPCATGQCGPASLFYDVADVCLDVTSVITEARQIIIRDATGAPIVTRFEDLATGQPLTGTIVQCPC